MLSAWGCRVLYEESWRCCRKGVLEELGEELREVVDVELGELEPRTAELVAGAAMSGGLFFFGFCWPGFAFGSFVVYDCDESFRSAKGSAMSDGVGNAEPRVGVLGEAELKRMFPAWASPAAILERLSEEYGEVIGADDIYTNDSGSVVVLRDFEHVVIFPDDERPGLFAMGRIPLVEYASKYGDANSGYVEF